MSIFHLPVLRFCLPQNYQDAQIHENYSHQVSQSLSQVSYYSLLRKKCLFRWDGERKKKKKGSQEYWKRTIDLDKNQQDYLSNNTELAHHIYDQAIYNIEHNHKNKIFLRIQIFNISIS